LPRSTKLLATAIIYTRVSKEEQARDGVSLAAQVATCRRYAAERGWLLGPEFQDVLSGRRDDRPAYQELLTEARRMRAEGRPAVVVVMRLDRLGRRLLERVRCREELASLGVPVHSVREGGEVSDLAANILAAVAEEEVRVLGERVSAARAHIAGGGWYLPGRAPWGYRWRDATPAERAQGAPKSVLEADPETAPFVIEAFARAAAGASVRAVHRWVVGLPEAARGGRGMTYQAVRQILASPVYAGRPPAQPGDPLAGPRSRWPALVEDATWRRVRDGVAQHAVLPRQASQAYLLSGLLRCPRCGSRMQGKRLAARSISYKCMKWQRGTDARVLTCAYTALAAQLDSQVLAEAQAAVEGVVGVPGMGPALGRAWEALRRPTGEAASAEQRLNQLDRISAKLRERLTRSAILFADGELDRASYQLATDATRTELEAAEAEIERLGGVPVAPSLPPLEEVLRQAGGWGAALRDGETAAQREVLALLLVRVVPVRVGRGKYAVQVDWTPLGEALRAFGAASSSAGLFAPVP
jgi:DNA invertase Pin-like site-specific DNA recombinase